MLNDVPNPEDLKKENQDLAELKQLADSAGLVIQAGVLSKGEAGQLITQVKERAQKLFPDKMETFELIYESRLKRLMEEFGVPDQL